MRKMIALAFVCAVAGAADPDWGKVNNETLKHFQTLVRMDTSDPPGHEAPAVEYIAKALEAEGIPYKVLSSDPKRPNIVARIKGSGAKKPILVMGHTDVVNVEPSKWPTFGPFSADRNSGYIYGRGTVDDKDNLVASLMTVILLKRAGAKLDRDVIFLAESGEEGNPRFGIQYMVDNHWPEIEAEYCLAEGGGIVRRAGKVISMNVSTTEKVPSRARLVAKGTAGHGSVPLPDNSIAHLSQAIAKVVAWQPPMKLNDTTREFFERVLGLTAGYRPDFDFDGAWMQTDTRRDYGEPRMVALGYIGLRIMSVVFVDRPPEQPTERRIISLRKANSREVKRYAET